MHTLNIANDHLRRNPTRFIFPVRRGAKTPPLITDNLNKATNDPDLIQWWHRKFPGCNWAIALRQSKLLVVDIDAKPGHVGQDTFETLDLLYGWPPTETVMSPGGNNSRHLYYDAREYGHVFKIGKFGFGPDIDSPNYVLIPGCTLDKYQGKTYGQPAGRIVPAPAWFYSDFLCRRGAGGVVDQEPLVALDSANAIAWAKYYLEHNAPKSIAGQAGEFTTYKVAATLKDRGISYERAIDLMGRLYNVAGRCDPLWHLDDEDTPSGETSLTKKIGNAYSYATMRAPGELSPEHEFPDDALSYADPAATAREARRRRAFDAVYAKPKLIEE